jgi:hypothetical protein
MAGGLIFGLGADRAGAAPLPSIAALNADASAAETVGWRRRYYRRGYLPPPGAVVDPDAAVIVDDDDGVVVVVPLRPASCGEFRYWNGVACVDARFNDPYIGPK